MFNCSEGAHRFIDLPQVDLTSFTVEKLKTEKSAEERQEGRTTKDFFESQAISLTCCHAETNEGKSEKQKLPRIFYRLRKAEHF